MRAGSQDILSGPASPTPGFQARHRLTPQVTPIAGAEAGFCGRATATSGDSARLRLASPSLAVPERSRWSEQHRAAIRVSSRRKPPRTPARRACSVWVLRDVAGDGQDARAGDLAVAVADGGRGRPRRGGGLGQVVGPLVHRPERSAAIRLALCLAVLAGCGAMALAPTSSNPAGGPIILFLILGILLAVAGFVFMSALLGYAVPARPRFGAVALAETILGPLILGGRPGWLWRGTGSSRTRRTVPRPSNEPPGYTWRPKMSR